MSLSLSARLNILLGGMTPLYFHIVNVCLHCAATCLLMHTCERCVFEKPRLAFVTALLFAVHPVHTEAVSTCTHRSSQRGSEKLTVQNVAYVCKSETCLDFNIFNLKHEIRRCRKLCYAVIATVGAMTFSSKSVFIIIKQPRLLKSSLKVLFCILEKIFLCSWLIIG